MIYQTIRTELQPVNHYSWEFGIPNKPMFEGWGGLRTDKLICINITYPLCFIAKCFKAMFVTFHLCLCIRPINERHNAFVYIGLYQISVVVSGVIVIQIKMVDTHCEMIV